jgi:hypothetical protein
MVIPPNIPNTLNIPNKKEFDRKTNTQTIKLPFIITKDVVEEVLEDLILYEEDYFNLNRYDLNSQFTIDEKEIEIKKVPTDINKEIKSLIAIEKEKRFQKILEKYGSENNNFQNSQHTPLRQIFNALFKRVNYLLYFMLNVDKTINYNGINQFKNYSNMNDIDRKTAFLDILCNPQYQLKDPTFEQQQLLTKCWFFINQEKGRYSGKTIAENLDLIAGKLFGKKISFQKDFYSWKDKLVGFNKSPPKESMFDDME